MKESETVIVQVREKKRWKKYPCTVRNDSFVQFKDSKVSYSWMTKPYLHHPISATMSISSLECMTLMCLLALKVLKLMSRILFQQGTCMYVHCSIITMSICGLSL